MRMLLTIVTLLLYSCTHNICSPVCTGFDSHDGYSASMQESQTGDLLLLCQCSIDFLPVLDSKPAPQLHFLICVTGIEMLCNTLF